MTNRTQTPGGFGNERAEVTYWTAQPPADPTQRSSWTFVQKADFHRALALAADSFPHPLVVTPEEQKHVTLLVHGFNNTWQEAMQQYARVVDNLYTGPSSLGECVVFDWPSQGNVLGYLPDRVEARKSAQDLADILSDLYDWQIAKQSAAAADPKNACKAKTSLIAHSMGNYVLEVAMNYAWTKKNRPMLVSLIDEALMIAADVDNDLFRAGESYGANDGEGLANLSYRVTALYTGRDAVLGTSAGLKHFGKRRLGRSGLDLTYPVPDNVWEVDCTHLIKPAVSGIDTHSAYFDPNESGCYPLMRELLRGIDRRILSSKAWMPAALPRRQPTA